MSTKIYYPGSGASKTLIGTIGNDKTKATLGTATKYMENDILIEQILPNDKIETQTVTTTGWTQSGSVYSKTLTFTTPTTANTIVDVSGDYNAIREFIMAEVNTFYVENNSGTFTLYSVGAIPANNVTLQFCLSETD